MLSDQEAHPLSLSLSLSEMRVHSNYSLISCALFLKHSPTHEFKLISSTDSVDNPGTGGFVTFNDDIRVELLLDWKQQIRVELRTLETADYNITAELQDPLLVAYAEFPLTRTLVAGKEFCISLHGVSGIQCSVLHINTREMEENKLTLIFKCSSHISYENKSKRDILSKLLRKDEAREDKSTNKLHLDLATKYRTGVMQPFLASELRELSEEIEWDTMYASVSSVREFNLDNKVWIRLWQRDQEQECIPPYKIAQCCETLRSLLTCGHGSNRRIELTSTQTEKGHRYIGAGSVIVSDCRIVKLPTFADYLLGGYEISLTLAIDFSVSNGNHTLSSSYHHLTPNNDNTYMECIKSVIDFALRFSNKSHSNLPVVVYGFGAVPTHLGNVSHCFALNQEERDPTIHNSDTLWRHYENIVRDSEPAGPVPLAHVIHKCLHDVMAQECYTQYRVCYVLTAGAVCDVIEVKNLLVESAKYPLSFVLVGIGDQKGLEKLEEIIKADKLTSSSSCEAVRSNIVYRKWDSLKSQTLTKGQNKISAISLSLTSILLKQFTDYYRLKNITPPGPTDTRDPKGAPYRSLTKQTSLYGNYVSADVSDIEMFQDAQLQLPSATAMKKESSIGHPLTTPLNVSLIKPITLTPDLNMTPLSPQRSETLQYSSYVTPLTHEDSLRITKYNID